MKFEELLQDSKAAGLQEGIEIGQNLLLNLIQCMTDNGQADEISKLGSDREFLQAMLHKYHLA